jgi:AGCS family alanine or glycine:cation symporter
MVQCNSVSGSMLDAFAVPKWVTGIVLAAATAAVVIGGIKSIGRVTGILVPAMICIYVGLALFILVLHVADIPDALALIFREAFSGKAGAGGFLGAAMMMALREGVRRGLFSNESGLGSSPIAAAAARTSCPSTQALVSMTQTFIDTICVCTLTGLVIIVTGAVDSGEVGVNMTQAGFADGLGSDLGRMAVAVCLALFAFSTVIGWSYYGERSLVFLVGEWALKPYRLVWVIAAFFGASIDKVESVWHLADIFNGLMAFPNLVALLLLTPVIMAETRKYFHGLKCNDV